MKPYKIPQGYMPWKRFQEHRSIFEFITPQTIEVEGYPKSPLKNLSYLFQEWGKGYPVYCLTKSLLGDILRSDVGDRLELFKDIKLAIPTFAVFFPSGSVEAPRKGCIDYLIINHQELDLPDHKHLISWGCIDSGDDTVLSYKRIRRDGTLQASGFFTDDEAQKNRVLQMRNIVLQIILILQYYSDEVIKSSEPTSKLLVNKGFGVPSPSSNESLYQLPRWLGNPSSACNTNRRIMSKNSASSTSKSTHFRRGHWRKLEKDIVWVRPSWINASI